MNDLFRTPSEIGHQIYMLRMFRREHVNKVPVTPTVFVLRTTLDEVIEELEEELVAAEAELARLLKKVDSR